MQLSTSQVLLVFILLQHMVENFVRRIAMDVQRSSVLREWNVWTYRRLVWEQCVECALVATLEMERNALVKICVFC